MVCYRSRIASRRFTFACAMAPGINPEMGLITSFVQETNRVPKSHELSASLKHFDVISRSTSISHALALLWKITLLFGRQKCLQSSIEGVNMPGFNKLVRFRRFEKCKIQKFSGGARPWTP